MKASSDGEEDDEDDDDDFDEVPEKEGYEPNIPEHLRAEYGKFIFIKTDIAIVDAFINSVSQIFPGSPFEIIIIFSPFSADATHPKLLNKYRHVLC